MIDILTFDTSGVYAFFSSLVLGISSYILLAKYLFAKFRKLGDNRTIHFLLSLAIGLSCSIVLINWESYSHMQDYTIEDVYIEDDLVIPTSAITKPKPPVPPPPIERPKAKSPVIEINTDIVDEPAEVDIPLVDDTKTANNIDVPVVAPTPPPIAPIIEEPDDDKIEIFVDQMPRFPGCEEMDIDIKAIEECAKARLLEYIYETINYPSIARQNDIHGLVVVQFVVSKDGKIEKVEVVKDIGAGCGKEALRAVQSMNDLAQKWTPGKQKGRPVNVRYTLPVNFTLF